MVTKNDNNTADQRTIARLRADQKFRQAITAFAISAAAHAARTGDEVRKAFAAGQFRMVEGVTFHVKAELKAAELMVVRRGQEILGSRLGDERDLSSGLWRATVMALQSSETADEHTNVIVEFMVQAIDAPFTYVAPNYLIKLQVGLDRFDIGPVSIRTTTSLIDELARERPGEKWSLAVGDQPDILHTADGPILVRPPITWVIKLRSSQANLSEEAGWYANVATSFLRMSGVSLGTMSPMIGKREPEAFQPTYARDHAFAYTSTRMTTLSSERLAYYEITKSNQRALKKWVASRQEHIFHPKAGSLGERIARGLGWLSRGRQSTDRSERFVFFFTALESLISAENPNPQLTDNLARMSAVIWTNGAENRSMFYRKLKRLYDKRSKLVHRGLRDVSVRDVNTAQYAAEQIYFTIMHKADLSQSLEDFHRSLAEASFGERWPARRDKA